jgi:hypothetical protein
MSLTETVRADELARKMFDEMVVPLAKARKAANRPDYFPRKGDPDRQSYFDQPAQGVMQPIDFEFPGGGDQLKLIDELAAAWMNDGNADLAELVPRLKVLAEVLREEVSEGDGSVDILCYTMF